MICKIRQGIYFSPTFIRDGFISWFNHFVATVIKKTVQKEKISIKDGKKLYFIDSKLKRLVVNSIQ